MIEKIMNDPTMSEGQKLELVKRRAEKMEK